MSITRHRLALAAIYLIAGLVLASMYIGNWESLVTAASEIDTTVAESGTPASFLILLLTITAPISYLLLAYSLKSGVKHRWQFLPLVHSLVFIPVGIIAAMYFLWWYFFTSESSGA